MCPLQVNPMYDVLEIPRLQWEPYNGTWEVHKLSTFIMVLLCFIINIRRIKICVPTAEEPHLPRAGKPAPAVGLLRRRLGGAQTFNIYSNIFVLYYQEIKYICAHCRITPSTMC